MSLYNELKRRNVIRVAIAYVVAAWLLIEVSATTFPMLMLPEWTATFVTVMLMIGFPVALIFAWAYELTPEGIKKERDIDRTQSITHITGRKLDYLIIAVLVVALGYFAFDKFVRDTSRDAALVEVATQTQTQQVASEEVATESDKSIAVLPFANLSSDEENAFFADGVHEDVLTNLAKVQSFKVISRSSVLRFRENRPSMREMAEELRCNYIVEGSVRRAGNRVLITVQLIDSRDDTHLWAQNYERELVDIFAIQSSIAREIADQLETKLSHREIADIDAVPTNSVKAYDYFLKARAILQQLGGFHDPGVISQAVKLLESAVNEDANFLQAWVHLVKAYSNLWRSSDDSLKTQILNKAQSALARTKEINADDPWTRWAASYYQYRVERDYPAALDELTSGGALPRLAELMQLEALISRRLGLMDRAIKLNQEALELDSGNLSIWREQAENLYAVRRFKESAQAWMRASFLEPQNSTHPIDRLQCEFLDSADVSLVDRIEEYDPEDMVFWLIWIQERKIGDLALEIRADKGKLKSYTASPTIPVNLDSLLFLFALLAENESELAHTWAENFLKQIQTDPSQFRNSSEIFLAYPISAVIRETTLLAVIHHLLGETEQGKAFLDQTREIREREKDPMNLAGENRPQLILGLQYLDPDEAAEMMIQELQEPISFLSLDAIAAFHWSFRNLIIHPRIQPLIVAHENGKWLNYLSERVPEYAKYKKP